MSRLRIGSVAYLNARPLVHGLPAALPGAEIRYEVPSRLADMLADGRLDVALAPCIELARRPDWKIISNACIGCRGPVLSVQLLFRKRAEEVATLAVDEGSRTSVVLAQILLADIAGVRPQLRPLPLSATLDDVEADAMLVIGDRAIRPASERFIDRWDLGDRWSRWTELPLAFAAWIVRDPEAQSARCAADKGDGDWSGAEVANASRSQAPGLTPNQLADLEQALNASRDVGVASLREIAEREAPSMQLTLEATLSYLRDNLNYYFRAGERRGLELYFQRAHQLGLISCMPELRFYESPVRS